MVNIKQLEEYLSTTIDEDFELIKNLTVPLNNLDDLLNYKIIKKRIENYSKAEFMNLYETNPLLEIEAAIERKDTKLNNEFNLEVKRLKNDVDNYKGSSPRKIQKVNLELERLSTISVFLDSDYYFNIAKKQIRNNIYDKVNNVDAKTKLRNKNLKNLLYLGLVMGGMFLGSKIFTEKEYITIDKKIYENSNISTEYKIEQYTKDMNYLSKHHIIMYNEALKMSKKSNN